MLTGKWTLAFVVKTIRNMDPTRKVSNVGTKRKRTCEREGERYLKRGRVIKKIKERLNHIIRFSAGS